MKFESNLLPTKSKKKKKGNYLILYLKTIFEVRKNLLVIFYGRKQFLENLFLNMF